MLVLDTHIVGLLTHPVRLSDYAIGIFDAHLPSRKSVKKAILKGALIVNGEVGMTATWITTGDQIELIAIDEPTAQVFELDLEVIYEDDYLALINKPGGIPIHGHQLRTLTNALPYNIKYSTQKDALASMRPVHRLDAATCGLLLVAKTKRTQIDLSRQFQEKKVSKVYTALVCGKLENNGSIELAIEGKAAKSTYQVQRSVRSIKNDFVTEALLYPLTGRTHQLRIHMASLGAPILGDPLYGEEGKIKKGRGLFLCASQLSFFHPYTKEKVVFKIVPPAKFEKTLMREEQMWKRKNSSLG